MKLVSGIVDSGFFAQSALSAEVATKDSLGRNISETYLTGVDLTPYQTTADMVNYQTTAGMTAYLTAVPEGYATTADLTGKQDTLTFGYNESNAISSINESAIAAGSTPTYGYTDNGLISAIDASGLYATSAGTANNAISADALNKNGTMGGNIVQSSGSHKFYYMPGISPFGRPTGIYSPLQYATGACLTMAGDSLGAFYKGNEWYVSNTQAGQALRGEVHYGRGVHLSGATTAGYGFNLAIGAVSGVNSTGSWKYGHAEDAALRAVSSCDMHESAFEYDASDNITGYNGSAFKAGDEFPQSATEAIETVTANSGTWETVSDKLDSTAFSTVSSDFYTTANESGFISEVPAGTMNESAFEYDANDKISGYNGSAFAQGGGVSYSAGDNISISNDIISVTGLAQADWSATSGAAQILNKPTEKNLIAGANVTITESNDEVTIETTEIASGLQLVAGPGIKFEMINDTLVASTDETVLFEDTNGHGMDVSIELSENVDNFDSIKIYYNCWAGSSPRVLEFFYDKGNSNYVTSISNLEQFSTGGLKVINWQFSPLDSSNKKTLTLDYFAYFEGSFNGTNLTKSNFKVFKVIGINRIAGGN